MYWVAPQGLGTACIGSQETLPYFKYKEVAGGGILYNQQTHYGKALTCVVKHDAKVKVILKVGFLRLISLNNLRHLQ